MRLSESRVRQIIREEASRVLHEAMDDAADAPRVPGRFAAVRPTHTVDIEARSEGEAEEMAAELEPMMKRFYQGWRVDRHRDGGLMFDPLGDSFSVSGPGGFNTARRVSSAIHELLHGVSSNIRPYDGLS